MRGDYTGYQDTPTIGDRYPGLQTRATPHFPVSHSVLIGRPPIDLNGIGRLLRLSIGNTRPVNRL